MVSTGFIEQQYRRFHRVRRPADRFIAFPDHGALSRGARASARAVRSARWCLRGGVLRNLEFLGCEVLSVRGVSPSDTLAGRAQFAACSIGLRIRAEPFEGHHGAAQVGARLRRLPGTSQGFSEQELDPGPLERTGVLVVDPQRILEVPDHIVASGNQSVALAIHLHVHCTPARYPSSRPSAFKASTYCSAVNHSRANPPPSHRAGAPAGCGRSRYR